MKIKAYLSLKGLALFIFAVWVEILIFFFSLIVSEVFYLTTEKILKILKKKEFYLLDFNTLASLKISFIFILIFTAQFKFSEFSIKIIKKRSVLFLYLANAIIVSSFFIRNILARTDLRDFHLLYLGISAVMIGSASLILLKETKN